MHGLALSLVVAVTTGPLPGGGAVFDRALAVSDARPAAVRSLLTSRYGPEHRLSYAPTPKDSPTLAEVLRARGYRTAAYVSSLAPDDPALKGFQTVSSGTPRSLPQGPFFLFVEGQAPDDGGAAIAVSLGPRASAAWRVRAPDLKKRATPDTSTLDVAPTALGLLGMSAPGGWAGRDALASPSPRPAFASLEDGNGFLARSGGLTLTWRRGAAPSSEPSGTPRQRAALMRLLLEHLEDPDEAPPSSDVAAPPPEAADALRRLGYLR